jgi:hypothetical protein
MRGQAMLSIRLRKIKAFHKPEFTLGEYLELAEEYETLHDLVAAAAVTDHCGDPDCCPMNVKHDAAMRALREYLDGKDDTNASVDEQGSGQSGGEEVQDGDNAGGVVREVPGQQDVDENLAQEAQAGSVERE